MGLLCRAEQVLLACVQMQVPMVTLLYVADKLLTVAAALTSCLYFTVSRQAGAIPALMDFIMTDTCLLKSRSAASARLGQRVSGPMEIGLMSKLL